MLDLLTIGDSSIDLYMKVAGDNVVSEDMGGVPKICFTHGSKIPVDHFETSIAGNAVHIAIGAKKLGLKTAIYTELGDDESGNRITTELKKFGVETKYCIKNKGCPTNLHAVVVYGGDRTIFSYHDKREYKIVNWDKPKWLYYTSMGYGFEGFQLKLIDYLQKNRGTGVAFNPGTIQMKTGLDSFRNFLKVTDILFVNKEEAEKLVGKDELKQMHIKLQQLGPKMTVITQADQGASAFDGSTLIQQPVYTDERPVLDKTGAGDAFSTGFLSAIIYGKSMQEALSWGLIDAGCCIKIIGGIKGLLTKEELESKRTTSKSR
jgi:ribokinase